MTSRKLLVSALIPVMLLMLSGCSTANKAKQGAVISKQMYEEVSSQVVGEIEVIIKASDAGTITSQQRKELATLNDLRKLLNKYSGIHNEYVGAIKLIENSTATNNNSGKLARELATLSVKILDYCDRLGIKI